MGESPSEGNLRELYRGYTRYMERLEDDLRDPAKQVVPEGEKLYRVRRLEFDAFCARVEADSEFRLRWEYRLEKGYNWERDQIGKVVDEILKCPACVAGPVGANTKEEAA